MKTAGSVPGAASLAGAEA
jgi:hypothetical protein